MKARPRRAAEAEGEARTPLPEHARGERACSDKGTDSAGRLPATLRARSSSCVHRLEALPLPRCFVPAGQQDHIADHAPAAQASRGGRLGDRKPACGPPGPPPRPRTRWAAHAAMTKLNTRNGPIKMMSADHKSERAPRGGRAAGGDGEVRGPKRRRFGALGG